MKLYIRTFLVAFVLCSFTAQAQKLRSEVFSLLNLDYPGLSEVKTYYEKGDEQKAIEALLDYYRHRQGINHPDVDLKKVNPSQQDYKWANDALEHTFFVHTGYQPSFNYGKDINWQYWPVQDNELRWQLHRHKWFSSMGKVYYKTKDERYAKEWVFEYMDWIQKNPLKNINKSEYKLLPGSQLKALKENVRFAWRPLEVSHRLQDQTGQFLYFIQSPNFTPEFLSEFLLNYHTHAVHILNNYTDAGNHLLFEAQRMIYAGAFFPEYKEALSWRKSGIEVLNREIGKQVFADGWQFELDPHYHLAAINIFYKAIQIAEVNGFRNEFPQSYLDMVESMIVAYFNVCYPDYANPCFSDAKTTKKKEVIGDYQKWSKVFPENKQILWFATDGQQGEKPAYLSKAFSNGGFYIFRNSWDKDANMMVVKAGPAAFWHCQPDNGTFEMWFKGKNLFPDSGSYVYAGDDEVMKWRNWFRSTKAHNTVTLNNQDLETTQSELKLWKGEGNTQILVTENPSYKNLKHRRSVFYVDQRFYVLVDEAVGTATGDVDLHYNFCEGKMNVNKSAFNVQSDLEGINVELQCFGPKTMTLQETEGWTSPAYRVKNPRTAVSFHVNKQNEEAVRYITIIYPTDKGEKMPKMKASFDKSKFNENELGIHVQLGKKKYKLNYQL